MGVRSLALKIFKFSKDYTQGFSALSQKTKRKSTPHYMLLAELGRYPLEVTIKLHMVGFWTRIVSGKETKLSYILYKIMRYTTNLHSKWINYVKTIFDDCGKSDVWLNDG